MPDRTKIATCCYCGSRSVLQLGGTVRHELQCASCGAPIRAMKALKSNPARPAGPRAGTRPAHGTPPPANRKKKTRKRKRSPLLHLVREVFDEIEDLFD
jgi:hypothetical protein